jgi:hypothetical protein
LKLGRRPRPQAAKPPAETAGSNGQLEEPVWPDDESLPAPPPQRRRLGRDPRHVRAVPTNAQLKLERAIDLFNSSEHLRTVTGLSRTLGEPRVSATTSSDSAAEVLLTIAWDISWYQFVVDLSDSRDPVRVESKGQEIDELTDEARAWNGRVEPNGTLAIGSDEDLNGQEPAEDL